MSLSIIQVDLYIEGSCVSLLSQILDLFQVLVHQLLLLDLLVRHAVLVDDLPEG